MKYLFTHLLLFILAGVLFANDGFRTWNMIGGGHFEAKLNAVATTTVTLENHAGKMIDFPLADLKPSDQEYVRDWQHAQSVADSSPLISAFHALRDHMNGTTPLSRVQIASCKAIIDANKASFADSADVVAASFELVETYDQVVGPLWVQGSPVQSIDRNVITDGDIEWVIFNVMQHIMDITYTNSSVVDYEDLFNGFKFGSSAHFPGLADPPADPNHAYTVQVNGSYANTRGWLRMHDDMNARKATGTYLAPGTVVTVTVPSSIVNKGYQVRVCAQRWDLESGSPGCPRNPVRRLDRVSLLYDINRTEIKIASPLGGGIYIDVPYLSDAGVIDVNIKGAIRAPFFSDLPFRETSNAQWKATESKHPAPWADFQSEKFMMTLPTDWIYNHTDPEQLLADWDKATDIYNEMMGFPRERGRETFYIHADLILRGNAYYPGYPTANIGYNPNKDYGGMVNNHFARGPQAAGSHVFHEQGHAYLCPKLPGEVESIVNLGHVAVWNVGFGYDLDTAFAASRRMQKNPARTLDNTAIAWMVCENFKYKEAMEEREKKYQLKGHAKFVDIAQLFGWEAVNAYFKYFVDDVEAGTTPDASPGNGGYSVNEHILSMSRGANCDVRPLFEFWGIYPNDAAALASDIAAENLPGSDKIYDRLVYYKSLVPANQEEFQSFALAWWKKPPSPDGYMTEANHASLWDNYNTAYAATIESNIQDILDAYYPDGRAATEFDRPVPNPMTWAMLPVAMSEPVSGVILSTDFETQITSGNTSKNIKWNTVCVADPGDLIAVDAHSTGRLAGLFDTVDAQGHFAPDINVANEGPWSTALALNTSNSVIRISSVELDIQHFNNLGDFQTSECNVDWMVSVSGSLSGLLGTAQVSSGNILAGTVIAAFDPELTLIPTETYTVTILAEGTNSGNNTGLDALVINGTFSEWSASAISMTATEAFDVSGVEYYFTETSGNIGGDDSGWQDSRSYKDTGLLPNTQYFYTVMSRDKSGNHNTSSQSAAASAITAP